MKIKTIYSCQKCGSQYSKWVGQCTDCGAWNSIIEEKIDGKTTLAKGDLPEVIAAADVTLAVEPRLSTDISELDRVLGGGLVNGSTVLLGGDPGIGKSTLILQALGNLSNKVKVLYVTGEESLQQVAMRAKRLALATDRLNLLAETNVETIIATTKQEAPEVLVIDSIQTIFTENIPSAPGTISQVRESTAQLIRFCKQNNIALFIVGHVTKEGTLAGPRTLEHMVDSVLYFEGERDNRYRMIRAVKNRFGAVNELGIFVMTEHGLKEVTNPSAIFLSRSPEPVAGSVILATWEGSRPLLVELQALVDQSYLTNPRRVTVGLEQNRLNMLLAVLHRHGRIPTYNQDVFVNVVGGVRIAETAADLALLLAVISSLKNKPLPQDLIVFGEVGLSGEIRPVQNGQERLKEAAKHGFAKAAVPLANAPKKSIDNLKIVPIRNLREALDIFG